MIAYVLETFGFLPYTPDSHFGEYVQWAWEMADIPGIRRFVQQYIQYTKGTGERLRNVMKKGKGYRLFKPDNERAVPIIEGILRDSNHQEPSVNIPNNDIITNLPRDLVVECPAIVNKDGIHGIKLGDFPKGLAALLRNQASVQDLVVEAVIKKSRNIALQALLVDPIINSTSQAEKILDYMLNLQKDHIYLR